MSGEFLQKRRASEHCSDSVEAPELDGIADHVGAVAKPSLSKPTAIGPTSCRAWIGQTPVPPRFGITARGSAPVLALCRALMKAEIDPATPLEALAQGEILCLRISSNQ